MKKRNILKSNKYKGSSETLREKTLNFNNFKTNFLPKHKKNIDISFLEWFVGFSEGDGSFIVSKGSKQLRLFFIITQNDLQVLHMIRTKLGFGRVQKHGKYFRYCVSDKEGVERLIAIFNGNLVLDKTNKRFQIWLAFRNHLRRKTLNRVCYLNKFNKTRYLNCSWFSGFAAAESCFNLYKRSRCSRLKTFSVGCRFIIDQRSEILFLNRLKKDLGSGYIDIRKDNFNHRLIIGNSKDLLSILKYFRASPLRTKKNIDLVRFKKMIVKVISRKKIPWEGKVLKRVLNLLKNSRAKV